MCDEGLRLFASGLGPGKRGDQGDLRGRSRLLCIPVNDCSDQTSVARGGLGADILTTPPPAAHAARYLLDLTVPEPPWQVNDATATREDPGGIPRQKGNKTSVAPFDFDPRSASVALGPKDGGAGF